MAKNKNPAKSPRKAVRFKPDPGTIAEVIFEQDAGKPISLHGLVINESSTGCAIILVADKKVKKLKTCRCRVGQLGEMTAFVRWAEVLDKGILKMGLEYDLGKD